MVNPNSIGLAVIGFGLLAAPAHGATFSDTWKSELTVSTFQDARTDDNKTAVGSEFRWDIDPGADVFEQEQYERPTNAMDETLNGVPAAKTYYEFLDIVSGNFANDTVNGFAYFSINLVGDSEVNQSGTSTEKGFEQRYRVRIADNADFAYGYMFGVDNPTGNIGSDTSFGNFNANQCKDSTCKATYGWIDSVGNGAVTGTGLTTTGEGTLGYDAFAGPQDPYIQSRIVDDSIEIAIAYELLGIDNEDIFDYIIFEATKGLTDPQNYFWNDEYTLAEGGDPYDTDNPPDGNIYELDTLKGFGGIQQLPPPEVVPLPAGVWLLLSALGALGITGWRRKRLASG